MILISKFYFTVIAIYTTKFSLIIINTVLTGVRAFPTTECAMKLQIPLPSFSPNRFLKSPFKNTINNTVDSNSVSNSVSTSTSSSSSSSTLNLSSDFNDFSSSLNSTSLPMNENGNALLQIDTAHTPNNDNDNDGTDDTSLPQPQENTTTQTTTLKNKIKDSSIMATSMHVVRGWRDRRCIHIEYVLGCRTDSTEEENVSTVRSLKVL